MRVICPQCLSVNNVPKKDSYKKAANELNNPEEEIPSPGVISAYIEDLPEADQANALTIVNDWFDNLEE